MRINAKTIKNISMALIALFVMVTAGQVKAQDYPVGTEGIKGATVPPPGFYYVLYTKYYEADKTYDKDGDEINNGFDLSAFIMANRFVYITNKKILGGDYGMNVIVPVVNLNVEIDAAGIDDDSTDIGDITFEPLLISWHGERWDASTAIAAFLPTGYYEKDDAASIGSDRYTLMYSLGATVYPDAAKLWSISVLTRYEKHFKNRSTDVRSGDDFSFDWGIGRQVGLFELGVSGFAHWQLTEDKGSDATSTDKDRLFGAGPEVQMNIPAMKGQLRLKYQKEFGAKDCAAGDAVWFTIVKSF
ncbi:MAG: transporter [Deferribacterales bacterium]|jgi:hypothetical protein